MPKQIMFGGTSYSFPDDATDAEIAETLAAAKPPMPAGASLEGELTPSTAAGDHVRYKNPVGPLTKPKLDNLYDRYSSMLPGWAKATADVPVNLAKSVGSDVVDTVKHPIDNAASIGGTIGGVIGGPNKVLTKMTGGRIPNVMGAVASGLGGAAGEAVRQTYGAATGDIKGPQAPSPGELIQAMLTEGGKQGAAELGGRYVGAAGRFAKRAAPAVYESLLKPTKTLMKHTTTYAKGGYDAVVKRLTDTGLKENIPVSAFGGRKAEAIIDEINDEITNDIAGSTATIPAKRVAGRLNDVRGHFAKDNAPQEALAAIDSLEKDFLSDPKLTKPLVGVRQRQTPQGHITSPIVPLTNAKGPIRVPARIKVQDAQVNKKAQGGILKNAAYGELKGPEKEGRKALVRGWKEEIADAVPSVGPKNARESDLIFLNDAIDDAVVRQGNANRFSITDVFALANLPRGSAALAASMANKPWLGNKIARGAYRGGKIFNPAVARGTSEAIRHLGLPNAGEASPRNPLGLSPEEEAIRRMLLEQ